LSKFFWAFPPINFKIFISFKLCSNLQIPKAVLLALLALFFQVVFIFTPKLIFTLNQIFIIAKVTISIIYFLRDVIIIIIKLTSIVIIIKVIMKTIIIILVLREFTEQRALNSPQLLLQPCKQLIKINLYFLALILRQF